MSQVIKFATANTFSADGLEELAENINKVYFEAEGDLFCNQLIRTSKSELEHLISESHLLIMFADESLNENDVLGCMYLKKSDSAPVASFGMLCVFDNQRGSGFGRALLDFAESWASGQGCTCIQLSLLSPIDRQHSHKQFLESWYTRRGYEAVQTLDFNWPGGLTRDCDFRLFSKSLVK